MKKYIFLTTNIKQVGGNQCYLAAKAQYLESVGWKVFIFFPALPIDGLCPIKYLNKYLVGSIIGLLLPPFKLPKWLVRYKLSKMVRAIRAVPISDEIIIESHEDSLSQWGEMLAKRLGARHFFFTMSEHYRGGRSTYEDKIDFYIFKYKRNEILGSLMSLSRLFEGHLTIKESDITPVLIDECPVQDVECKSINELRQLDYNICYIGQGTKPYVPNIISGVADFANNNSEKKILFVIVGVVDIHRNLINRVLSDSKNLKIVELGFLHPLPKKLYDKIDVVIAGSGSARHSVEEGALTIVADSETKMANGLLGYDTLSSIYRDEDSVVTTFCDALVRVLVEKCYIGKENKYPAKLGVEKCTKQNFELFSKADKEIAYYEESSLLAGELDSVSLFKVYAVNLFPGIIRSIKRLLKNRL